MRSDGAQRGDLRWLSADEQGASAIFTALALSAVLGFVALGLNAAGGLAAKRDLQQAADRGADAGARALRSGVAAAPVARALAKDNLNDTEAMVSVEWPPAAGRCAGDPLAIAVEISRPRTVRLGGLLGADVSVVRARAVGAVIQVAPGCLLALDPAPGSIRESGSGRLLLDGCEAFAAGPLTPAARLPQVNPYSVPAASTMACVAGTLTVSGVLVVRNGAEPQPRCGGVRVAPGGRLRVEGIAWRLAGPLHVEAGGRLETWGATLWTGPHPVEFAAGAQVELQPPMAGSMAGVALLGASTGPPATSRLVAGSGQKLTGAILLPTQTVELAGNAAACTQVVAGRILVSGITRLGHACAGVGVKTLMDQRVALVE
ncbi:hypothetical protein [Thermaurantiacus sp.]